MNAAAGERLMLKSKLRRALERDEGEGMTGPLPRHQRGVTRS